MSNVIVVMRVIMSTGDSKPEEVAQHSLGIAQMVLEDVRQPLRYRGSFERVELVSVEVTK